MITVVFGSTQERANNYLKSIYNTFDNCDIKRRSKDSFELFNGDYYSARIGSSNARGVKCHKAFVDVDISIRIYNEVIKFCIIPTKIIAKFDDVSAYEPVEKNIILFGF